MAVFVVNVFDESKMSDEDEVMVVGDGVREGLSCEDPCSTKSTKRRRFSCSLSLGSPRLLSGGHFTHEPRAVTTTL